MMMMMMMMRRRRKKKKIRVHRGVCVCDIVERSGASSPLGRRQKFVELDVEKKEEKVAQKKLGWSTSTCEREGPENKVVKAAERRVGGTRGFREQNETGNDELYITFHNN